MAQDAFQREPRLWHTDEQVLEEWQPYIEASYINDPSPVLNRGAFKNVRPFAQQAPMDYTTPSDPFLPSHRRVRRDMAGLGGGPAQHRLYEAHVKLSEAIEHQNGKLAEYWRPVIAQYNDPHPVNPSFGTGPFPK